MVARRPLGLWSTQDALQPLEAMERKGIFARMTAGLAAEHGEEKIVMIDATYLKAHRSATSLGVKKGGVYA